MNIKIVSLFLLVLFSLSTRAELNSDLSLSNGKLGLENYSVLNQYNRGGGGNHRGAKAYKPGNVILSIGYGALNFWKYEWANTDLYNYDYYSGDGYYENYKVTGIGPLHFKAEYALSEIVSLGLSINYVNAKAQWTDYYNYYSGQYYQNGYTTGKTFNSLSVLGRMNLHFATSKILDPYFGFGIGYRNANTDYFSDDPTFDDEAYYSSTSAIIPIGFEMSMGLRVYVSPNIGFFTEVGLTKSLIQGGLAIKI